MLSSWAAADDIASDFRGELIIPEVARFDHLPARMYMLPEFTEPVARVVLPDDFVPMFVRVLSGKYDNELHRDAARSLERVANEKLADPDQFKDALHSRLQDTDDRAVVNACVMALVASDDSTAAELLSKYCTSEYEGLAIHIEPKLAEWKNTSIIERWQQRIKEPLNYTHQMTALACRCLGEIGDASSVDTLVQLVLDDRSQMTVRQAAAKAVGRIDPAKAGKAAAELISGGIPRRVLAASFLETANSNDSFQLLLQLCDDSESAISSRAWFTLQNLNPSLLVGKLPQGIVHPDANIRGSAISVMQQLPTLERCEWLMNMLADEHLYVRNNARIALHQISNRDSELKSRILSLCGSTVQDESSSWQDLEQSMLLLGQQSHSEYQAACIPLLKHARNEVMVTAAWLLHLMPQAALSSDIAAHTQKQWNYMKEQPVPAEIPRRDATSIQLMFLFHHGASTADKAMEGVCREMFSKDAPTVPETRAVALWALGYINAGRDDEKLRGRFVERVFDDSPVNPEHPTVKSGSAYSLGTLGMKNSIADLNRAHATYTKHGTLGACVCTALNLLGVECSLPEFDPITGAGPWPLFPAN